MDEIFIENCTEEVFSKDSGIKLISLESFLKIEPL